MSARSGQPERLLAEAYAAGDGCPPPATFLDEAWDALSTAERAMIERHAQRCPACRAERRLARAFSEPTESCEEDVAYVVSRIERADPASGAATVHPARRGYAWGFASAAAVLAAALALTVAVRDRAPDLPRVAQDGAVRGARIEVRFPVGALDAVPSNLRWTEFAGASEYRVLVLAVDDQVLWEGAATGGQVELPDAFRRALHAAVAYRWQVEAFAPDGRRLAVSDVTTFTVRGTP